MTFPFSHPHPVLFDWLSDTPEPQRAHCLADLLVFVSEALDLSAKSGTGKEFRLSAAGADGLSHLLAAIEQSLRIDVTLPDTSARGTPLPGSPKKEGE